MLITPKGTGGLGINGSPTGDVAGSTLTAKFCVKQDENGPVAGFVKANNSSAYPGSTVYGCRSRGTLLSPTIVQDNDTLFSLLSLGFDGTDLAPAAQIDFEVDGTPGANDMPGKIVFKTSPDGSQTTTEAMNIDSTQTVNISKLNATGTISLNGSTGTSGYVLTSNGASAPTWQANSNGITVADDTTTNSTFYPLFANATSGTVTTQYVSSTKLAFNPSTGTLTATALSGTLSGSNVSGNITGNAANVTGTVAVANGGTGATTLTGVLKGNGTSAITAATAGTDFVAPGTATTFTALQTFSGSSSVAALKTTNIVEVSTVSATAATGTINYDVTTQSVLYYTSNASGNFTLNFRGSSGTSLNTIMATGDTMVVSFLVTNGSTAYYNSAVQIDGSSVTPKWQGGNAPSSGNASSIDAYTYAIVKTGSATFTVLASQTKFA
jgi:hypothetical protein